MKRKRYRGGNEEEKQVRGGGGGRGLDDEPKIGEELRGEVKRRGWEQERRRSD